MAGKYKNMKTRFGKKKYKGKKKLSKPLRKAIKQVIRSEVESKTINVVSSGSSGLNSLNVPYGALSGVQYLVRDIFSMPQGTEDSTLIGAPNRVGDKIRAVGFLCDYYFTIPSSYTLTATFGLPYVKLRITLFTTSFGIPPLSSALLYDTNFLAGNTSTLQPLNWDEGYLKTVLYDKVVVIHNSNSLVNAPNSMTLTPIGNVFHWRKYFKYDKLVRYSDNQTTTPNATLKPIFVAISAEVDDAFTGLIPSGTTILRTTGYTRGWFKDA